MGWDEKNRPMGRTLPSRPMGWDQPKKNPCPMGWDYLQKFFRPMGWDYLQKIRVPWDGTIPKNFSSHGMGWDGTIPWDFTLVKYLLKKV